MKFNVAERPTGRAYLTASIAGCASEKATIAVKLNGTVKATWKPGYKDASVYRSAVNSGRHYLYTVDFPSTDLKIGTNLITFQTSNTGGKNGFLYDCIKLEAGTLVTSGVEDIRESVADGRPSTYKHIVNGRLVIEKLGRRYSLTGTLLK